MLEMFENYQHIYTDGSCNNKTKVDGSGGIVMIEDHQVVKTLEYGLVDNSTSARMEILGVLLALDNCHPTKSVRIYCDNEYVVKTYSKHWIFEWESTGFIGKKNEDLWRRFLKIYREKFLNQPTKRELTMTWIKGHANNKYNERCDFIATQAKARISERVVDNQTGLYEVNVFQL